MLKREQLAKIGYEERSALPTSQSAAVLPFKDDNRSMTSYSSKSMALEPLGSKPKAIDYLNKGNEGKESVKDYINFSR
jgi:hypothetical protein